uniref:Reverse transcriptase domain-containing protein n=1 Tax=Graphocephala atropunctata TaxID=36148 RepID=A0A1B6L1I2_9HEMI
MEDYQRGKRKNKTRIVTDPLKITNILNDFFINPLQEEPHEIARNTTNHEQENIADTPLCLTKFHTITEAELTKLFTHIKTNNAAGYDEITGKLLKHCKEVITTPLLHIINTSITECKIP